MAAKSREPKGAGPGRASAWDDADEEGRSTGFACSALKSNRFP